MMSIIIESSLAVSADIEAALADLRRMIGSRWASASLVYGHGEPCISLAWNGAERGAEIGRTSALPTLTEMLVEAREMIRAAHVTRRNNLVRRLALAIIETTDEHTSCTTTLLRAKGFTDQEIEEFRDAACRRASEMAGNAPFSVEAV